MRNTWTLVASVVALSSLLGSGCSVKPATVEVSPPDVTINSVDETPKMKARVLDEAGQEIPDAKVLWSTPDETVLGVDPETGALTIKGSGRAEVDAEAGVAKGLAMVTVALFEKLVTDERSLVLKIGEMQKVEATVLNEKKEAVSFEVVWTVADPKVAKVNHRGEINGIGAGTTIVTGTAKKLKAEVMVEVMKPGPADLQVSKALLVLKKGKTGKVEGLPMDENGKEDKDYTVAYESYDEDVATVETDGTVTGVAPGETKINVTAGDKAVEVKVRVE